MTIVFGSPEAKKVQVRHASKRNSRSRFDTSLFEQQRLTLPRAIELSLDSLRAYGADYKHWVSCYSGGKDSSANTALIAWAILNGHVDPPESFTILYADTRMELLPLHYTAMQFMDRLKEQGFNAQVVLPAMKDRYMCYMLGLGVPPSSNTFRWCTPKIKVEPLMRAIEEKAVEYGFGRREINGSGKLAYVGNGKDKFLSLTGVRMGESAVRDQRIAVSCGKDSGECGQGWFQSATPAAVADTLAPLLHWRICHVYDWLYFEQYRHGYDELIGVADVYGQEEMRTGCIGCPLTDKQTALIRVCSMPEWAYLSPLLELKSFYRAMRKPNYRKRKAEPELLKDGTLSKSGQRMGPLTIEARKHWFCRIMNMQQRVNDKADQFGRPQISLINDEEAKYIQDLWTQGAYPQRWSADDINADVPVDKISVIGEQLLIQPNMFI